MLSLFSITNITVAHSIAKASFTTKCQCMAACVWMHQCEKICAQHNCQTIPSQRRLQIHVSMLILWIPPKFAWLSLDSLISKHDTCVTTKTKPPHQVVTNIQLWSFAYSASHHLWTVSTLRFRSQVYRCNCGCTACCMNSLIGSWHAQVVNGCWMELQHFHCPN